MMQQLPTAGSYGVFTTPSYSCGVVGSIPSMYSLNGYSLPSSAITLKEAEWLKEKSPSLTGMRRSSETVSGLLTTDPGSRSPPGYGTRSILNGSVGKEEDQDLRVWHQLKISHLNTALNCLDSEIEICKLKSDILSSKKQVVEETGVKSSQACLHIDRTDLCSCFKHCRSCCTYYTHCCYGNPHEMDNIQIVNSSSNKCQNVNNSNSKMGIKDKCYGCGLTNDYVISNHGNQSSYNSVKYEEYIEQKSSIYSAHKCKDLIIKPRDTKETDETHVSQSHTLLQNKLSQNKSSSSLPGSHLDILQLHESEIGSSKTFNTTIYEDKKKQTNLCKRDSDWLRTSQSDHSKKKNHLSSTTHSQNQTQSMTLDDLESKENNKVITERSESKDEDADKAVSDNLCQTCLSLQKDVKCLLDQSIEIQAKLHRQREEAEHLTSLSSRLEYDMKRTQTNKLNANYLSTSLNGLPKQKNGLVNGYSDRLMSRIQNENTLLNAPNKTVKNSYQRPSKFVSFKEKCSDFSCSSLGQSTSSEPGNGAVSGVEVGLPGASTWRDMPGLLSKDINGVRSTAGEPSVAPLYGTHSHQFTDGSAAMVDGQPSRTDRYAGNSSDPALTGVPASHTTNIHSPKQYHLYHTDNQAPKSNYQWNDLLGSNYYLHDSNNFNGLIENGFQGNVGNSFQPLKPEWCSGYTADYSNAPNRSLPTYDLYQSAETFSPLTAELSNTLDDHMLYKKETLYTQESQTFLNDSPFRVEQFSRIEHHLIGPFGDDLNQSHTSQATDDLIGQLRTAETLVENSVGQTQLLLSMAEREAREEAAAQKQVSILITGLLISYTNVYKKPTPCYSLGNFLILLII